LAVGPPGILAATEAQHSRKLDDDRVRQK